MKIEKIYISDINDVLEMQKKIYEQMEEKESLERISRTDMTTILEDNYSVGVYKNGKLVAMRGFLIPKISDEEHLADDADVDRETTIYSEIALVHPDARGAGLQLEMGKVLLEELKKDKRFKHLIATIMPLNLPSLKNSLKLGLNIVNTTYKYGGKRRHILYMNLEEERELKGNPIHIKYDDFDWFFEHGKEYIGTELMGEHITYYKK